MGEENAHSFPEVYKIQNKHDLKDQLSLPVMPIKPNNLGKNVSLLQRLSSIGTRRQIPSGTVIRQQFHDLLTEPISEQHQQHFRQYFGRNIDTKTFTVTEFGVLFQINPILSRRILMVFELSTACEMDSISGEDVIRIARLLWISPMSVKAFILFKLFDSNDNDKISFIELRAFYKNYLKESKVFKDERRLDEVVNIFLEGFFPQQQQELDFDEFYQILQDNPGLFKSLYLISIPDQGKDDEEESTCFHRWWMYIKNNTNRFVFRILYILSLIALIIYVAVYRSTIEKADSVWQIFARIGGILINYNFAICIILMLKQTMTIIRRLHYLRLFIPVDDHIDAHRLVGGVLSISVIVHTLGHAIHFGTHTEKNSLAASIFTTAAEAGWAWHSAAITGDILCVLLFIMVICSLQCIRQRSGCYQLFRYTHLLFWPIFILLVIHARDFWKWVIGPMTLFFLEKIYLCRRYFPGNGRTRLISVIIEDPNVMTFIIERPKNFHYHVGEYVNICLPNIAPREWHPFTICSAPEEDVLRLSIMKKKNWTRKVYEHFSSQLPILVEVTTDTTSTHTTDALLPNEIRFNDNQKDAVIYIEGPFSTCTSYIFDCEHVVLIGGGIGITPYISALKNLIHQLREERCICSKCGAANYNKKKLNSRKLKKVDFIWINRDVGNFSWFLNTLDEFEAEQESYLNSTENSQEPRSRYLDIHLYCTSIRRNKEMLGHLPYDLVANMHEIIQHEDMLTQLRTPTHVGRPPWKLLFAKFKAEHRSTHVFFTGNKIMGEEIKEYCDEHGFAFNHEPYF